MDAFICTACGTQYTPSSVAPRQCAICEEERQYVPPRGQTWTTLAALTAGHFNSYRQYEPGVIGVGTQPPFVFLWCQHRRSSTDHDGYKATPAGSSDGRVARKA